MGSRDRVGGRGLRQRSGQIQRKFQWNAFDRERYIKSWVIHVYQLYMYIRCRGITDVGIYQWGISAVGV